METDSAQVLNQQIDTCKDESTCIYMERGGEREREREKERELTL